MFGEANMKLQPNSRIAYPVGDSQTRRTRFQSKGLQLGQGIKNDPGVLVFGVRSVSTN